MTDDLAYRRQLRCAESDCGHDFPEAEQYGTCTNCGLTILPAERVAKS